MRRICSVGALIARLLAVGCSLLLLTAFALLMYLAANGLIRTGPGPLPAPTPRTTVTLPLQTLRPSTAGRLVELQRCAEPGDGPIAALTLNADQTLLLAASLPGQLRHWRVADGRLQAAFEVAPLSLRATTFTPDGTLLATAAGALPTPQPPVDHSELEGVRVWHAMTGTLALHLQHPTRPVKYAAVALSPDGKWAIASDDTAQNLWDLRTGELVGWGGVADMSTPIDFDTALAFDATSEYVASANENGRVDLNRWHNGSVVSRSDFGIAPATTGFGNPIVHPLALAFDPTRRWLAAVRDQTLEVWTVRGGDVMTAPIPASPTAALAFTPDGQLLAVGTAGGWQLWAVREGRLLLDHRESSGVYALTFSADGRLFAWGDAAGSVHLWGVPAGGGSLQS